MIVGDPEGACDDFAHPLNVIMSNGLRTAVQDSDTPEALRSPALEAIQRYKFSELQMDQVFAYWLSRNAPTRREAVCQWVVDNIDALRKFVPETYPRELREGVDSGPLMYAATGLGGLTTLLVLQTGWAVYQRRRRRVVMVAQIEFLGFLLTGLLLISVGATLLALPAADNSCVAVAWLVLVGYTLELLPLLVKVTALNRLLGAGSSMRRISMKRSSLFGSVMLITAVVLLSLVAWTLVDPPQRQAEYELVENADGATVVMANYHCESKSFGCLFAANVWHAVLLLCAAVLAVATRHMRRDFNESRTLAILIYSDVIFLILRTVCFLLSSTDSFSESTLARFRSILYSVNVICSLCIYFLRLVLPGDNGPRTLPRISGLKMPRIIPESVLSAVTRLVSQGDGENVSEPPPPPPPPPPSWAFAVSSDEKCGPHNEETEQEVEIRYGPSTADHPVSQSSLFMDSFFDDASNVESDHADGSASTLLIRNVQMHRTESPSGKKTKGLAKVPLSRSSSCGDKGKISRRKRSGACRRCGGPALLSLEQSGCPPNTRGLNDVCSKSIERDCRSSHV